MIQTLQTSLISFYDTLRDFNSFLCCFEDYDLAWFQVYILFETLEINLATCFGSSFLFPKQEIVFENGNCAFGNPF
jgi:hypothetical protein